MKLALFLTDNDKLNKLNKMCEKEQNCEIVLTSYELTDFKKKSSKVKVDLSLIEVPLPQDIHIEALNFCLENFKTPCVIVSFGGNQGKIFSALAGGALDVINFTGGVFPDNNDTLEFKSKLDKLKKLVGNGVRQVVTLSKNDKSKSKFVAIGCSTGGPKMLNKLISALPAEIDSPIVIVQHVVRQFSKGLVQWLSSLTSINLKMAEEGEPALKNTIYVAGGEYHLSTDSTGKFLLCSEPEDNPYRPSVDVYFSGLAKSRISPGLAFLLTGMGHDGARGLLDLRNAGWNTTAQDAATSFVYGMPKVAAELGAAMEILSMEEIVKKIVNYVKK